MQIIYGEKRLSNILNSVENKNWFGFAEELLGAEERLNPNISCTVETCKYWGKGIYAIQN